MTEGPGSHTEPAKEKPKPGTEPTGGEGDPFAPDDPFDPLHLEPSREPAPGGPGSGEPGGERPSEPTVVDLPPDPAPVPGDALPDWARPSTGRDALEATQKRLEAATVRQDAGGVGKGMGTATQASVLIERGRRSLADQWSLMANEVVASRRARIEAGVASDTGMSSVEDVIATDRNLRTALTDWCTLRDSADLDLQALADAGERAMEEITRLKSACDALIDAALGDPSQGSLYRLLEGMALELSRESTILLSGRPVDPGQPSDALVTALVAMTRDGVWESRLAAKRTWAERGTLSSGEIAKATSGAPADPSSPPLDPARITTALSALDAALKASTAEAKAHPGEEIPYGIRADVLRGFTGTVAELEAVLATAETRRKALATDPKAAGRGWSARTADAVADLVRGLVRELRLGLENHGLTGDPDLGGAARTLRTRLDELASPTAAERDAQALSGSKKFAADVTRTLDRALQEAATAGLDTTGMAERLTAIGSFAKDWAAQTGAYPAQDPGAAHSAALRLTQAINDARQAARGRAGASTSAADRIVAALDAVATAVVLQMRRFDSRGGLFD